jgi:hypothetical protein
MNEYPQNRFRRLMLVGPSQNKRRSFAVARWWRSPRPDQVYQKKQATGAQFKALRMAVMPTLSRGMWLEAISSIARCIRSYFGTPPKQERGAVVLSFRRQGIRRPWAEQAADEGYVTKKASGSVCWDSDQAPLEKGRG